MVDVRSMSLWAVSAEQLFARRCVDDAKLSISWLPGTSSPLPPPAATSGPSLLVAPCSFTGSIGLEPLGASILLSLKCDDGIHALLQPEHVVLLRAIDGFNLDAFQLPRRLGKVEAQTDVNPDNVGVKICVSQATLALVNGQHPVLRMSLQDSSVHRNESTGIFEITLGNVSVHAGADSAMLSVPISPGAALHAVFNSGPVVATTRTQLASVRLSISPSSMVAGLGVDIEVLSRIDFSLQQLHVATLQQWVQAASLALPSTMLSSTLEEKKRARVTLSTAGIFARAGNESALQLFVGSLAVQQSASGAHFETVVVLTDASVGTFEPTTGEQLALGLFDLRLALSPIAVAIELSDLSLQLSKNQISTIKAAYSSFAPIFSTAAELQSVKPHADTHCDLFVVTNDDLRAGSFLYYPLGADSAVPSENQVLIGTHDLMWAYPTPRRILALATSPVPFVTNCDECITCVLSAFVAEKQSFVDVAVFQVRSDRNEFLELLQAPPLAAVWQVSIPHSSELTAMVLLGSLRVSSTSPPSVRLAVENLARQVSVNAPLLDLQLLMARPKSAYPLVPLVRVGSEALHVLVHPAEGVSATVSRLYVKAFDATKQRWYPVLQPATASTCVAPSPHPTKRWPATQNFTCDMLDVCVSPLLLRLSRNIVRLWASEDADTVCLAALSLVNTTGCPVVFGQIGSAERIHFAGDGVPVEYSWFAANLPHSLQFALHDAANLVFSGPVSVTGPATVSLHLGRNVVVLVCIEQCGPLQFSITIRSSLAFRNHLSVPLHVQTMLPSLQGPHEKSALWSSAVVVAAGELIYANSLPEISKSACIRWAAFPGVWSPPIDVAHMVSSDPCVFGPVVAVIEQGSSANSLSGQCVVAFWSRIAVCNWTSVELGISLSWQRGAGIESLSGPRSVSRTETVLPGEPANNVFSFMAPGLEALSTIFLSLQLPGSAWSEPPVSFPLHLPVTSQPRTVTIGSVPLRITMSTEFGGQRTVIDVRPLLLVHNGMATTLTVGPAGFTVPASSCTPVPVWDGGFMRFSVHGAGWTEALKPSTMPPLEDDLNSVGVPAAKAPAKRPVAVVVSLPLLDESRACLLALVTHEMGMVPCWSVKPRFILTNECDQDLCVRFSAGSAEWVVPAHGSSELPAVSASLLAELVPLQFSFPAASKVYRGWSAPIAAGKQAARRIVAMPTLSHESGPVISSTPLIVAQAKVGGQIRLVIAVDLAPPLLVVNERAECVPVFMMGPNSAPAECSLLPWNLASSGSSLHFGADTGDLLAREGMGTLPASLSESLSLWVPSLRSEVTERMWERLNLKLGLWHGPQGSYRVTINPVGTTVVTLLPKGVFSPAVEVDFNVTVWSVHVRLIQVALCLGSLLEPAAVMIFEYVTSSLERSTEGIVVKCTVGQLSLDNLLRDKPYDFVAILFGESTPTSLPILQVTLSAAADFAWIKRLSILLQPITVQVDDSFLYSMVAAAMECGAALSNFQASALVAVVGQDPQLMHMLAKPLYVHDLHMSCVEVLLVLLRKLLVSDGFYVGHVQCTYLVARVFCVSCVCVCVCWRCFFPLAHAPFSPTGLIWHR
jgi:hypothetical protein